MATYVESHGTGPDRSKESMTLLCLPIETRNRIYEHFLKIQTDVDVHVSEEYNPTKINLTLLHVCRQMRGESLKYLLDVNP